MIHSWYTYFTGRVEQCDGMLHMLSTVPTGSIIVSSDRSVLMHLCQTGQKFAVF